MIGVITCVNYLDYLKVTLPYNLHHFEQVIVVTSLDQTETLEYLSTLPNNVQRIAVSAFGTTFNKWAALEVIFKLLFYKCERTLLVNMDADIMMPKQLGNSHENLFPRGHISTPHRRMYYGAANAIPQEPYWKQYQRHHLVNHWSGYFHAFWTDDPVLRKKPWYASPQVKNAATGDTMFYRRWEAQKRYRPDFDVLHLGESGKNWDGRVTPVFE